MMIRTARGHTGRPLQTSVLETASYLLVHLGAAVRVFVPLVAPQWGLIAMVSKWAAIATCSPDTALRDITDLLVRGVLRKSAARGAAPVMN